MDEQTKWIILGVYCLGFFVFGGISAKIAYKRHKKYLYDAKEVSIVEGLFNGLLWPLFVPIYLMFCFFGFFWRIK